jgi:hypothetical protein
MSTYEVDIHRRLDETPSAGRLPGMIANVPLHDALHSVWASLIKRASEPTTIRAKVARQATADNAPDCTQNFCKVRSCPSYRICGSNEETYSQRYALIASETV